LIEASPTAFKILQQRSERLNSLKFNGVVGSQVKQVTYIDIQGYSAQLSCIKEFASPDHLRRISHESKSFANNQVQEISVEMKPLQIWLDLNSVKHIHFFSLDVEGAELQVLKTIDFSHVTIDILVIEVSQTPGSGSQIETFLNSNGYHCFHKTGQDFFFCRQPVC
jgi:FkbM family methyltransferase